MSRNHQITILKVAETAGVSKQTVSRVINNHPDVADVTRKHVQQVIDELGYHPSAVAQDFESMGAKTIELLVDVINAQRDGKDSSPLQPIRLLVDLIVRKSSLRTVELAR